MVHISLIAASILASGATAWNTGNHNPYVQDNDAEGLITFLDVHNQIGFSAEKFLKPSTTKILQRILEPQYNGSIGKAAAWADSYAHTTEGAFSYQWHWIDSGDNVRLETCPRVRLTDLLTSIL